MFDEQNKPTPPQPLEDIFDQTQRPMPTSASPAQGATPRPTPPPPPRAPGAPGAPRGPLPPPPPSGSVGLETKEGIRPKPFIIGGVILLILVLVVLGIWFFLLRAPEVAPVDLDTEEAPAALRRGTSEQDEEPPLPTPTPEPLPEPTPEPEEPAPLPDIDGDGLTDAEESVLGTNPRTADTDGDQLFDKEERDVYGTDPLNPDSDGDGYIDGAEVRNGYNPAGPGRLFGVPTQEPE